MLRARCKRKIVFSVDMVKWTSKPKNSGQVIVNRRTIFVYSTFTLEIFAYSLSIEIFIITSANSFDFSFHKLLVFLICSYFLHVINLFGMVEHLYR